MTSEMFPCWTNEWNGLFLSLDPCRNGATCIDGINRYTCKCIPGFTGIHCEINIDECASSKYFFNSNRKLILINDSIQINSWNSLTIHNSFCVVIGPCANNGVCMDLVNGFKCECPKGYYDSLCLSNIDECSSSKFLHIQFVSIYTTVTMRKR